MKSYLLVGEVDEADPILARAVEGGIQVGALPAASVALAERCLVAIERRDWHQAESLVDRARTIVGDGRLDDYVPIALVYAVAVRISIHRGEAQTAQEHLVRAARLRPMLTYATPHLAVQTLLELGRAYLGLGDAAGVRVTLTEASDIIHRRSDLGILSSQADELRSKLDTIHREVMGASSLTRAELRLLPLLPTHLTFREIGERLYISPQHGEEARWVGVPEARRVLPQSGRPAGAAARPRRVGARLLGLERAVTAWCRQRPSPWRAGLRRVLSSDRAAR
jgi:LuxR family transcriptional regulator, maltose regulon positive regulatory protein